MSVEQVLFIRHGRTEFNSERRLQGAMPVPLNDCGRQQSHLLGQYLRSRAIDAIYASPRARANETAQIIGSYLRRKVCEDERLAEIAFGDFEGHTFAEVQKLLPDAYEKWDSGYRRYRVPGGESAWMCSCGWKRPGTRSSARTAATRLWQSSDTARP